MGLLSSGMHSPAVACMASHITATQPATIATAKPLSPPPAGLGTSPVVAHTLHQTTSAPAPIPTGRALPLPGPPSGGASAYGSFDGGGAESEQRWAALGAAATATAQAAEGRSRRLQVWCVSWWGAVRGMAVGPGLAWHAQQGRSGGWP